jgi:hypothetical protein
MIMQYTTYFLPEAFNLYQNRHFWYENIPHGNPVMNARVGTGWQDWFRAGLPDFFDTIHTKTGKITKTLPNGLKIYQKAVESSKGINYSI